MLWRDARHGKEKTGGKPTGAHGALWVACGRAKEMQTDTVEETKPYTLADILAGIRAGVEATRHHEKPSRLKAAIEKALPNASVYYDPKPYGSADMGRISVWGGEVKHDKMITCYFRHDDLPWPDAVLWYVRRADDSDYRERMEAESKLYAKFEQLERQIYALRLEADRLVMQLPIPKAAVANGLRDKAFYWDKPQEETRKKFPNLFA